MTLPDIATGTPLDVLAEIGVILLLFSVGLETRLDDLKKVGTSAVLVGVLGVVIPFALGSLWAHGSGFDWIRSMFVAAAFVATSAGITARVLQELGVLQRREARIILGAAVIDDILAMLLLGVVSSLQGGGAVDVGSLVGTLLGAIGFVAVIGWGRARVMRRGSGWLDKPSNPMSPLAIVLALCLGLAFLSMKFHLAAIIGAFLAGMIASETSQRHQLEEQTAPLLAFLTPFFFVVTGAKVNLAELGSASAVDARRRHRHRHRLEARRRLPRRDHAGQARRDHRRLRHGSAWRGGRGDRQPRARRRRVRRADLRGDRGDVAVDRDGHATGAGPAPARPPRID